MDLKKILGNIGCAALSTVAAPIGDMASKVVREVLGLDKKASDKEVADAIKEATPDQLLALKKADNDFAARMKELDIDLVKLDKEDAKNARNFAERVGVKTVNSLAFANTMLVIITVTGVGFLVYNNSLLNIDALTASLLTLAVREVFAKQEQIYNFFFGSSSGSKEKTDILGKDKK